MKRLKWVWQSRSWPRLNWESASLLLAVSQARTVQGNLLSLVRNLGFDLSREASADILTEETVKTSAIEGERLNRDSVRSSVARHLGLPSAGLPPIDRSVDGLVQALLDATQKHGEPLTAARLKTWQAALFPTGFSGLSRIQTGKWRRSGLPMQVVSGPIGREKVHYEAPPGGRVEGEMKRFLEWWRLSLGREEGLLRSGLAHFYFVAIHPFEDGNGRVARALTDMALAQDEKLSARYYSFSSQIMREREKYYSVLEECSKGSGDVTEWLKWYLGCFSRAVEGSRTLIADVLAKADFWRRHGAAEINGRQRKVVNRLLNAGKGGFEGGLTTRKYVSIAKVSRATAFREILDLVEKKLLRQNVGKGRNVSYDVHWHSGSKI